MTTAFEGFLRGTDRLSEVLRTLPPYVASPALAERVAADALAYEAECRAESASPVFTAPASLEAAVMQEALAMERAQAPRREALRAALAHEGDASAALGAPVSSATQDWLRNAWLPAGEPDAAPPRRQAKRRSAWRPRLAFGLCCGMATLAGLTVWQYRLGSAPEDFPASPAAEVAAAPDQSLYSGAPEPSPAPSASALVGEKVDAAMLDVMPPPPAPKSTLDRMKGNDTKTVARLKVERKAAAPPRPQPGGSVDLDSSPPPPPVIEESRASLAKAPEPRDESFFARAEPSRAPAPEASPPPMLAAVPPQMAEAALDEMPAADLAPEPESASVQASPPVASSPVASVSARSAAPDISAAPVVAQRRREAIYSGPLEDERWRDLAVTFVENRAHGAGLRRAVAKADTADMATADMAAAKGIEPRRPQWRLLTPAPDAPAARALAATLREALGPDADLSVIADPSIPAGTASLFAP